MTETMTRDVRTRTNRSTPHLSASQLKSYSTCSLKWWFSRRYVPEHTPSALIFGRAFHAALQAFYQARLEDQILEHETLMAAFVEEYESEPLPVLYGKTESKESHLELAGRMLECFLAHVRPSRVVAVEEPFSCFLADGLPPLVGAIDLIEIVTNEDGAEELHLVDFKTAARKPADRSQMDPDQLTLYALAASRTGILGAFPLPFSLRYDIITKTKTPQMLSQTVSPDRQDALRLVQKARVIWRGMEKDVVFPEPGWQCSGCVYATRCREWPDTL